VLYKTAKLNRFNLKEKAMEHKIMTPQEAGRCGGIATRNKYGPDYYKILGRKGGTKTFHKHGPDYFSDIGKIGGDRTKANHSREYFVELGRKSARRRG